MDAVRTHLTVGVSGTGRKDFRKVMTSEVHLEVMEKLKWKGRYPSPSQQPVTFFTP